MRLADPLLLAPKLLYFGLNFSLYACYHFSYKYLKERHGVDDGSFGLLNALTAISFFTGIGWSRLADHTQQHRLIMSVAAALYAVSFCMLWPLETVRFSTNERFFVVSCCYLSTNIFISALGPLLDARVMMLLSEKGLSMSLFGRQRLWGAFGHAAVGLVSGYMIETVGYPGMFAVILISTATFILTIILLPSGSTLIVKDHPKGDGQLGASQDNDSGSLVLLLTNLKFVLFICLVAIAGVTRGVVGNYLQQLLEECYKIRPSSYAWLTATRIFTELAAYFIGKPLLDRLGIKATLVLGVITGALRSGFYGFMPLGSSWALSVPVVELLKGVNSAFIVVSGTQLAHELSPLGCKATAQGIFSGMYGGLGNALSGLFGTLVLYVSPANQYALRRVFQAAALLSLLSPVLFLIILKIK